jgi:hypothetical protein
MIKDLIIHDGIAPEVEVILLEGNNPCPFRTQMIANRSGSGIALTVRGVCSKVALN